MLRSVPEDVKAWAGRYWPEVLVAVLAGAVFLGYLGAIDLWGKREQRASAEALDTVDHNHWLVAQIQNRPRLEKPPLPRWTIASLICLTGRRDEWVVRLPGALAALATAGLVYALGRRLGGRAVGLASALVLVSTGFFIVEVRQAGNDAPLAAFTTLALYAAFRRLHAEGAEFGERPGPRRWAVVFYLALGLGFLTKGPVILLLAALALVPYLAAARRLRAGLGRLWDGWGALLFLALALCWPVPVVLSDPNAARVWMLEMGQKAGTAGVTHHNSRLPLAVDWFGMTLPWVALATSAVVVACLPVGRAWRPKVAFPWFWAVGNLAMFSLWSVAKPNYFLPCLPAAALLAGMEWVRVTSLARQRVAPGAVLARVTLQGHWVALLLAGVAAPAVAWREAPEFLVPALLITAAAFAGVVLSAWSWRRGADALALAPLTATIAAAVLVAYGALGPRLNAERSHRALAATIDRLVPPEAHTVMFFKELDEGLWFYLHDRELAPVPGSLPRYNTALELADEARDLGMTIRYAQRAEAEQRLFVDWIKGKDGPRASAYVLVRADEYERKYAPALDGLVTPLYRETGLKRNALILLRVTPPGPLADGPAPARR